MITVYAYNCADVSDMLLSAMLDRVSPERRAQAARFYHRGDAVRSVCGELLARALFCALYPGQPIAFQKGTRGKPSVTGHPAFHFNVSHSGDWVVCATADAEVGVDVERIDAADMRVADRFFAPEEIEVLHGMQDQDGAFYRLWTAKESYIKCVGTGLSMPLNRFSALGARVVADGRETEYRLHHLELDERHALCACAAGVHLAELVVVESLLHANHRQTP